MSLPIAIEPKTNPLNKQCVTGVMLVSFPSSSLGMHKRGYVDLLEHWRYSSYRNYFDTGLEAVFDGVEIVVW
jgi:hypothetical protein